MTTGPSAVLVMQSEVVGGGLFPLRDTDRCLIGRSPACDVVIDITLISRRHAQITYHDGAFFASDLGSRNGTHVNGQLLPPGEELSLSHGDVLSFADNQVTLRFQETWDSAPLGRPTSPASARDTIDTATLASTRSAVHTDLSIDPDTRQLWVKGNQLAIPLSGGEFDLLNVLYQRRGAAVANDELAAALLPEYLDESAAMAEIGIRVRQLRLRLEQIPTEPKLIVTLPGYGYILVGPPP